MLLWVLIAGALLALLAFVHLTLKSRGLHRCFVNYLLRSPHLPPSADSEIHLILCFADHYEPEWQGASLAKAQARVGRWLEEYPRLFGEFRDSDGRPPRWTFFYPAEKYRPELVSRVVELCRQGFGEMEIHLHHDHDTAESLRTTLVTFRDRLSQDHQQLARHRDSDRIRYAFIHGNWALCNANGDGRFCGVDEELDVLIETGCYADFTMPAAPDPAQSRIINQIYYASTIPGRHRSYDWGLPIGRATPPEKSLLMIPGPLVLNWSRRKFGLLPTIENACLQKRQPPSFDRIRHWLRASIRVPKRPEWFFVKLHCHGAQEDAMEILLGDPMVRFHRQLADHAAANPRFHYHYVTAREMYNLVRAAEEGWPGSPAEARDYELLWNGANSLEHA